MQNEALKEAIGSPRLSSPRTKPIVNIRTSAKHFVAEGLPYAGSKDNKDNTYLTEVLTVLGRRELESQQRTVLLGSVKHLRDIDTLLSSSSKASRPKLCEVTPRCDFASEEPPKHSVFKRTVASYSRLG
jgi:hypothetical protein